MAEIGKRLTPTPEAGEKLKPVKWHCPNCNNVLAVAKDPQWTPSEDDDDPFDCCHWNHPDGTAVKPEDSFRCPGCGVVPHVSSFITYLNRHMRRDCQ